MSAVRTELYRRRKTVLLRRLHERNEGDENGRRRIGRRGRERASHRALPDEWRNYLDDTDEADAEIGELDESLEEEFAEENEEDEEEEFANVEEEDLEYVTGDEIYTLSGDDDDDDDDKQDDDDF